MHLKFRLFQSALLCGAATAPLSSAWADVTLNAGESYTVSGAEAQIAVTVGDTSGPATLDILSGGSLDSGTGTFGAGAAAGGNSATVRGAWTAGSLTLGSQGGGNGLSVFGGGAVSTGFLMMGETAAAGGNSITVSDGGTFSSGVALLGYASDDNVVTVSGAGSSWTIPFVILGSAGSGNQLNVLAGGTVKADTYFIGEGSAARSNGVTVSGAGSTFTADSIGVGIAGADNHLTVSDGGQVGIRKLYAGTDLGSDANLVTVTGVDSRLDVSSETYVGSGGSGNALRVLDGAKASLGDAVQIGSGAGAGNNSLLVSGAGSTLVSGGTISVGSGGGGGNSLKVDDGGRISAAAVQVAAGNTVSVGGGSVLSTGSLTLAEGATLALHGDGGAAPQVDVAGVADLRGTIDVGVTPGGALQNRYTLITAGAITGLPTLGGTPNQNLAASLNLSGTEAWLDLTAQLGAGTSLGGSQSAVASALDSHVNGGGVLNPGLSRIYGLSGPALGDALAQVSGEVGASGGVNAIVQATDSFLALLAGGGGQASAPGSSGHGMAARSTGIVAAADAPPAPGGSAMWGAVYGGAADLPGSSGAGSHDTDTTLWGIATGWDRDLSARTRLGLAIAGGQTGWQVSDGLGSGDSTFLQLGAYGRQQAGAAYVSLAGAYAWHAMSTARTVRIDGADRLDSDADASNFSGRVEAGYRVAGRHAGFTPYAALQAQSVHIPGHDEHGDAGASDYALSYASNTATAARSEVGIGFDSGRDGETAFVSLSGRVAWAHDWMSDPDVQASFQSLGGSGFMVTGAAMPDDVALVSAGAAYDISDATRLAASFDGEFGADYLSYAGSLSLRYSW